MDATSSLTATVSGERPLRSRTVCKYWSRDKGRSRICEGMTIARKEQDAPDLRRCAGERARIPCVLAWQRNAGPCS
jgi:hypothetical protein